MVLCTAMAVITAATAFVTKSLTVSTRASNHQVRLKIRSTVTSNASNSTPAKEVVKTDMIRMISLDA